MKNLPFWHMVNKQPGFLDSESLTVMEQTAKLYGAMQELITEHNKFINEMNTFVNEHKVDTDKDISCFKNYITKIMCDYIESVDLNVGETLQRVSTIEGKQSTQETLNAECQAGLTDHEERLESLESSSGSSGGTQWYCHSVMFTDSGLPLTFISTRSTAYTRYQDIFIDFANGVLFGVSVDAPNTSYMRYIHMTWDIDFEKEIDYITLYDRNGNAMIVNYTLANYTPTKI